MPDKDMQASQAGQAIYTPLVLKLYDLWVLGVSNHWLWRCPTAKLRALYDRNVTRRHLDVGVGTGYYLHHAQWPVAKPEITLLDLNATSLTTAAQRIADLAPETVKADVLSPLPALGPFESVGLCYLLHCLPGKMTEKARVFDHVLPLMASGAHIFGATIVQGDAPRSVWAQKLMDTYNARGIFSNRDDDLPALQQALEA
ncbi:MAG: class I SAM-dependent methyltransferase, partial [Alphaproteobacteria bacterium]|nr:class I SAM-dependent methyltransferase [Alphaproteobacteria bacterium]